MAVADPRLLNEHYNKLFRSRDLDGLLELYETDAILCSAAGREAKGHALIREQLGALIKLRGALTAVQNACVTQGDLALLLATWRFVGTDEADNPMEMGGQSAKIARKGVDGKWRYVIDLPMAIGN